MPYNLLVLQLVGKRNILFTYLFYTFFSSISMNLAAKPLEYEILWRTRYDFMKNGFTRSFLWFFIAF